jgi:putative FmdB family regulatory protein
MRADGSVILSVVPVYEYVCRTCDSRFEARRSMGEAGLPIDCPDGHPDTARLLSVFASVGRSSGGAPAPSSGPPVGGCGAGCACAS